jgi:hypothetical protein
MAWRRGWGGGGRGGRFAGPGYPDAGYEGPYPGYAPAPVPPPSRKEELSMLEAEAAHMEAALKDIRKRMEALAKEEPEKKQK